MERSSWLARPLVGGAGGRGPSVQDAWLPLVEPMPPVGEHCDRIRRQFRREPAILRTAEHVSLLDYAINSCGVHITGAGNPASEQVRRMSSTMAALAIVCQERHGQAGHTHLHSQGVQKLGSSLFSVE